MCGGSLHELGHLLAHLRRVAHDVDTCSLEGSNLLGSTTLATGNNGTSVTHATAWGSSLASNEADGRQVAVVVVAEPLSSFLLGLATDLTNHDDTLSLGVVDELTEDINEVGAVEGITTNTDNRRLAEALKSCLVDSLVGQSTRAGNNTDLSLRVDVARHDTDLALARLDDSWAVRADQARFVLRPHYGFDLDHVEGGDSLSDADNEFHLGLNSLKDRISSEGRGHVDDRSIGTSGLLGL